MPYRLRVVSGKDKGTVVDLEEGQVLTLGRSPSNDICVNDHKMSRIHCQIELMGEACNLTDLNSTNGTFVKDEPIDEAQLEDGGSFSIGFTTIRFEQAEEGEEGQAPEAAGESKKAAASRVLVCNECGREIPEATLGDGRARQIGSGFYCSVCSREFADVELVDESDDGEVEEVEEEEESDDAQPRLAETHPSLDPLVGQTVAGNLVVEKIADGPLGSLYQAEQVTMKRTVALRVLNRGPEVTEGVLEGILENIRAVGKLSHSNIIVVYDAGEKHNLYYISMAYVEGESAREILLKHKRLVPPDALYIMSHIIRALRHAWRHGMVHGDVRPSNILVSKHGTSKLTDFGALPDDILERMRPARRLAYLRYASPERLAGEGLDITSDIYSLGATLYHMLCGQPPFAAESIDELQDLILHGEIPPPSSVRDEIPTELDEIILKMMAKGRHERHENPSDLLKALKRVASSVGQPATMA